MSADPAAEHVDAVAQGLRDAGVEVGYVGADRFRQMAARRLLTSTDHCVHAALAASLPTEVMLAALVERGAMTEFRTEAMLNDDGSLTTDAYIEHCNVRARQYVTPWEVAP